MAHLLVVMCLLLYLSCQGAAGSPFGTPPILRKNWVTGLESVTIGHD
jgi:hypothetical protein